SPVLVLLKVTDIVARQRGKIFRIDILVLVHVKQHPVGWIIHWCLQHEVAVLAGTLDIGGHSLGSEVASDREVLQVRVPWSVVIRIPSPSGLKLRGSDLGLHGAEA